MNKPFVDFHIHTNLSDGDLSPREVVRLAKESGIGTLAITDHDYTFDLTDLKKENPDITFVQGAEFTGMYIKEDGSIRDVHIIGLGFDPENRKIKELIRYNTIDRRPYVTAILNRLEECNIHIGSYDDLAEKFKGTKHLGRMHLAITMVEKGYVSSIDEAFDQYIGSFGAKKAYVENKAQYAPMAELVEAIIDAGGVAVLCHLYYYQLSDRENIRLIKRFKQLAGDRGAMEVFYSLYTGRQKAQLAELAYRYGLMASVGSDFHTDKNGGITFDSQYVKPTACSELMACLGFDLI